MITADASLDASVISRTSAFERTAVFSVLASVWGSDRLAKYGVEALEL